MEYLRVGDKYGIKKTTQDGRSVFKQIILRGVRQKAEGELSTRTGEGTQPREDQRDNEAVTQVQPEERPRSAKELASPTLGTLDIYTLTDIASEVDTNVANIHANIERYCIDGSKVTRDRPFGSEMDRSLNKVISVVLGFAHLFEAKLCFAARSRVFPDAASPPAECQADDGISFGRSLFPFASHFRFLYFACQVNKLVTFLFF